MTAVTETTTIIETLIGRTLEPEQLVKVADAVCWTGAWDKASISQLDNFPSMTNEEKAQVVQDDLLAYLRSRLKEKATADIRATIAAAQAASLADLA